MPRESIGTNCDLTFNTLCFATTRFTDKFGFLPHCLEIGVDNIFVALDIRKIKSEQVLKDFYFYCDKDFPSDYWQVIGIKDGEKYIIYSEGV